MLRTGNQYVVFITRLHVYFNVNTTRLSIDLLAISSALLGLPLSSNLHLTVFPPFLFSYFFFFSSFKLYVNKW